MYMHSSYFPIAQAKELKVGATLSTMSPFVKQSTIIGSASLMRLTLDFSKKDTLVLSNGKTSRQLMIVN